MPQLEDVLDAMAVERDVRATVEEFNERVIKARYRPAEGPPLITMPRDVEATVDAWRERRASRQARAAAARADLPGDRNRKRWWRAWRRT